VRQFSYDNLQRRTQELWLDGQTTVNTIDFAYDAASQLTSASDDFSGYEYAYDGLGRVTQIDVAAIGTSAVEARLLQTFDASGNRTSLAAQFDIGSGWVDDFLTSFTFDDLNRMNCRARRAVARPAGRGTSSGTGRCNGASAACRSVASRF
jgi:YD repeat-containing protein